MLHSIDGSKGFFAQLSCHISFLEAKGIGISEPSSGDGTEQPPLHRGTYHIAQVDCINALAG